MPESLADSFSFQRHFVQEHLPLESMELSWGSVRVWAEPIAARLWDPQKRFAVEWCDRNPLLPHIKPLPQPSVTNDSKAFLENQYNSDIPVLDPRFTASANPVLDVIMIDFTLLETLFTANHRSNLLRKTCYLTKDSYIRWRR